MSRRLAVLLRAINVGGTGKLPMADFKALLGDLGFGEPKTLGAAGSAVIGADADPGLIEDQLQAALKDSFGLASEVFVRSHPELKSVLAANPFTEMAQDQPSRLLVLFLKGDPAADAVAALRGRIMGPEEVHQGPRSLFVAYGEGMGTSKLTGQLIERGLSLRGTGRNWNTVQKLADLTAP